MEFLFAFVQLFDDNEVVLNILMLVRVGGQFCPECKSKYCLGDMLYSRSDLVKNVKMNE